MRREEEVRAYPLCWPAGKARCKSRKHAMFKVKHDRALEEMLEEVRRMKGQRVVVSTNMKVRQDGMPYAKQVNIWDVGVAVYFWRDGKQVCVACDQYTTITDNVRAIGLTLECMRGIERYGGNQMLEQAFRGFAALPSPIDLPSPWWEVLGLTPEATEEGIRAARVSLARRFHPDSGSEPNESKMKAVNAAADEGIEYRRRCAS